MKRDQILEEVKKCILKDRQNTYGNAEDNFQIIANMWNYYLDSPDIRLTKKDVAIMMMFLKIARMKSSPNYLDNYIDTAGYAIIAGSFCDNANDKK